MTSHFESSCGNEKRKLATNKVRTDGRTLRPENKNLVRWLLKRRKKASFLFSQHSTAPKIDFERIK